ncbi:carbohydate-binding domain-containing protein [Chitinophaga pendula]|nr:carbohydate-binding domain-containing protein [Chitinophaga pendula]
MLIKLMIMACLMNGMMLGANAQTKAPAFDASRLKASWGLVENNHQGKRQFLSAFTFVNNGKTPLPASGWQLYFNFVRSVKPGTTSTGMKAEHVNGDLYKLTPTADFKGLKPGESFRVEFVCDAWVVNFTDAPGGLYLVWDNQPEKGHALPEPQVLPSTEARQFARYAGDKVAQVTAASIYNDNNDIRDIPAAQLPKVFPTPVNYKENGQTFVLDASTRIETPATFNNEASYLRRELRSFLGKELPLNSGNGKAIILKENPELAAEAYTLEVNAQHITISASSGSGIFYGIQSLRSLIPPDAWKGTQPSISIPGVQVNDAPRFGYRGFFLDVARNFHSKEELLRVIDLIATYKLNFLHLHFNDDEGWRLEIPGLPELTSVGAYRGHSADGNTYLWPSYGSGPDTTNKAGNGYYSRKDFIDILRYATDRHIRVLPEIESPGHARAAVKSMEVRYHRLMKEGKQQEATQYLLSDLQDKSEYHSVQYWNDNIMNPALPAVYTFLDAVVVALQDMYREAGAPLTTIHMGGDEVPNGVWEKSPAIQDLMKKEPAVKTVDDVWYYYYKKVYDLVKARNLELAGWEEVGMRKTKLDGKPHYVANPDFANNNIQLNVWNNVIGGGAEDLAYRLANAGYKVVLSGVSNFYFDMAYGKSFDEPGFYWGGFIDVEKPFYFIPFNYYKNSKVDGQGNPVTSTLFVGKDKLTDFGKSNIVGIQGLLWSETIKSPQRLEYSILPKLLGLAERAWAKDPEWATEPDNAKSEQMYKEAWSLFSNIVGKRELPRLDYYNGGYAYRIPPAGAVVEGGMLKVNVQHPGLIIRYTTDGKEPGPNSKVYTQPIPAKGKIKVRVFDTRGRSGRPVEVNGELVILAAPDGPQLKDARKKQ